MLQTAWLNQRRSPERGFVFVFFAIASFALLALVALALGLGVVATGGTRLQQAANLAALGALKEYVDRRSEGTHSAYDLADLARERANFILENNKLAFTPSDLGNLRLAGETEDDTTGGVIEPGSYFPEDPDAAGALDPCAGPGYPCFLPVDPSNFYLPSNPLFPVNAVRVTASNSGVNPIIAPIAAIMGQEEVRLRSEVLASLAQRCVAFVLDVSISTTSESHRLPSSKLSEPWVSRPHDIDPSTINTDPPWIECDGWPSPNPPGRILCPNNVGMFAMHKRDLTVGGGPGTDSLSPLSSNWCQQDGSGLLTATNNSGLVWCNISFQNGNPLDRGSGPTPLQYPITPGGPSVTLSYYRQYYLDRRTPYGVVRIDHVNTPEPLATFLTAFNAGLRLIQLQTTGADGAVVVPFGRDVVNMYPSPTATDRVERDLALLVQTTNHANRGAIQTWEGTPPFRPVTNPAHPDLAGTVPGETHPNYIDMGWFPVDQPINRDTDIVRALRTAIVVLADVNVCPASAQKSIVLATDGLPTCDSDPETLASQSCPAPKEHTTYLSAVAHLVGPADSSIRNQLRRNRISLTTLLRGELVQPNFNFAFSPSGSGYATLREMWAQSSRDEAAAKSLVQYTQLNGTGEPDAYRRVGELGVGGLPRVFRDPNWVFTYLSLDSGGLMCPLLDACTPAQCPGCSGNPCYEPDGSLSPCAQWPTNFICAPNNVSPTEQAARCVQQTVGGNPYILVTTP